MKLNNKTKSIFIILALIALIAGYMTYQGLNPETTEDNAIKSESEQIQTAKTDWDAYKEGNKSFASDEEKKEFLFETFRLLAHDDLITAINEIENAGEFEDMRQAALGVNEGRKEASIDFRVPNTLYSEGKLTPTSYAVFLYDAGYPDGLLDKINDPELLFKFQIGEFQSGIRSGLYKQIVSTMHQFYETHRSKINILSITTNSAYTAYKEEGIAIDDVVQRINGFLGEIESSGNYDSQSELNKLKQFYSNLEFEVE